MMRRIPRYIEVPALVIGPIAVVLIFWSIAYALTSVREINGTSMEESYGIGLACYGSKVFAGGPFAPQPGLGFASGGLATVINGISGPVQTVAYPLSIATDNSEFGDSGDFIDDVSGDGQPELVVGAPFNGANGNGSAFVYYDTTAQPSVTMNGVSTGDEFGSAIAGVNGMLPGGKPAILIAAVGANMTGQVGIFDGISSAPITTEIPPAGDMPVNFGRALAKLGDIDADGIPDFTISSQTSDGAVRSIYLYSGKTRTEIKRIDQFTAGQDFGISVADVGDVDGDGVSDLIVGAPSINPAVLSDAYLISGASLNTPNLITVCTLTQGVSNDGFGQSVAGLGDTVGDGIKRFAVAAPAGGGGDGAVYIYEFTGGNCVQVDSAVGPNQLYSLGTSLAGSSTTGFCNFDGSSISDFAAGTNSSAVFSAAGSAVLYANPTPTPTPTATPIPVAEPKNAKLTFKIGIDGTFTLSNVYDKAPDPGCELFVYARPVIDGKREAIVELGQFGNLKRSMDFSVKGMPRAAFINNTLPIVDMITVTMCGNPTNKTRTIDSNVFARYMNCGPGTSVPPGTWTQTLRKKFRQKYPLPPI